MSCLWLALEEREWCLKWVEPESSAQMVPESREAGSTCGPSTKLEMPFPADYTCELK